MTAADPPPRAAAFYDLPAESFPLTLLLLRADTREILWRQTVTGATTLEVPSFGHLDVGVISRIEFADGTVEYEQPSDAWSCMVCRDWRPDAVIAVAYRDLPANVAARLARRDVGSRFHVRHCTDRPGCVAYATAPGPWTGPPT